MENNIDFIKPFPRFNIAFQITKYILFEVDFSKIGSNDVPHFSEYVIMFSHQKTGYMSCFRGQENALPLVSAAKIFYKEWYKYQMVDIMDSATYKKLLCDLDGLKEKYNYIERFDNRRLTFYQLKKLSMLPLKKENKQSVSKKKKKS